MKTILQTVRMIAAMCAVVLMVRPAGAATTIYVGTNGLGANTNWSTSANFIDGTSHNPETPANNAANFNFDTAAAGPGIITVNVDGGYGTPGSGTPQAWSMIFGQTNGYHTVFVQPGITLEMIATSGTIGGGGLEICPTSRTSGGNTSGSVVGSGTYTNYTTFTGSGGTLFVNGQLHLEAQSSAVNNHYTILDMQGLGMYVHTNTSGGTPARFLLMNGGTRSQGIVYLAQTNIVTPRGDVQIGYLNQSSNSLPIGVYLGMTNLILTDPTLGNGNVLNLAIQGCTNGFLKFNPAFVGGPAKPTAFLSGTGGTMATVNIANANGAFVPSFGNADLTGGSVTWQIGNLQMGQAGTGATNNAVGVLTFDDGTVTVNTATVGWQTASSGGSGVGTINIGTNATFKANTSIVLGASTGTVTPGDAGTINVNGGTLNANTITKGGGTATITVSNGTFTVTGTAGTPASPLTSVAVTNTTLNFGVSTITTNISVASLTTSGANTINIVSAPPLSSVPAVIKLIAYSGAIGGAGYNFTLGSLPPLCAGSLSNDTANSSVDLVLTSGPLALTWDGDVSGNWNTTETNWFAAGPNFYADGDFVNFVDGATTGTVSLTATFTPGNVTVTNTALPYTFNGSGAIGGSGGLVKQGTGTLIIDNSGNNTYSSVTTISGGTLQVGNNDTSGNLPSAVVDNASLVFDRVDNPLTIANAISGTGSVTKAGGNTLQLSGANTFSGAVNVNNNSTLQLGSATAVGTAAGGLVISSGSTLDVNGFAVNKSITVSGTGVSGNGAITDSGGQVVDSALGLATNITLAGDTTFNFPTRWDLGQPNAGSALSTGGHAYNLTMISGANAYHEWRNLTVDAALANINVNAGTLGIIGSTSLGNPGSTLTVASGANMAFYNATVGVNVNKQWDLQNGVTMQNGGGSNVLNGPMTLEPGIEQFNVGGTSMTLSNVLSGSGLLYGNGGTSPLILWGNSPSFSGGVYLLTGSVVLNGTIGSGITANGVTTTVAGTGTATGLVDVSGAMQPGNVGVAGTFNAAGGLTLENGATLTMDLNSAGTVGGGVNDLITVTGDLAANNNPILINPIGGTLASSYTLLTYTGNATSFFSGAQTVAASRYVFTLTNVTTTTPKQVNLLVAGSGGGPASLIWDNVNANGTWDTQSSQNWSNQTTHVANDLFFASDSVTFDDSILGDANPTTTISIPAAVNPNNVTNNSTTNYTFNGAGKISGGANLYKLGSSTLTINTTNDFTGKATVLAGTVVQGTNNALGSATGTLYITNSGTVDLGGFTLGTKPIVVSGAGVNANGAIVNNGANAIFDNGSGLRSVTLSGNTTFGGGNSRWDLGDGSGGTLGTGGQPYNLSLSGNPITAGNATYWEWNDVTVDAALGNINILSGQLGVKGMTSIGNPASTLTIFSGGQLTFWGGSGYAKNIDVKSGGQLVARFDGPNFDFGMTLEDGSTFVSINNAKYFTKPVSLTGLVNFQIGNGSCTFSNVISGSGGFYVNNYDSNPLIFTATNTYSGPTLLSNSGSGLVLSLVGNGSISSSTNIGLTSGTVLDVSGRTDTTLTLTSVQTLEGSGVIRGNLTTSGGSTLEPGFNGTGTLTVTNAVHLGGTTTMFLGGGANNLLNATNINYGGTLSLSFNAGTLAGGNSFKLFNAANYAGSFANIVPVTPGAGLTWDTSQLTVSGTLRVASPPQFGTINVSGTLLTLAGTGGNPNGTYHIVSSTNVNALLSTWISVGSSNFDSLGHFTFTNSINPTDPRRFYVLVEP